MSKNIIFALARQNGSGGREIGRKLAAQLGISFYDKELLEMTAKKSGIIEKICEESEETATSSLLYSLSIGGSVWGGSNAFEQELPIPDRIFIAQSSIIHDIAQKESAVIVGRCADYILRDNPNCIRVFLAADLPCRMARIEHLHHVNPEKAAREIKRMDKKRASYYNYFTDQRWGVLENYTLSINTSEIGIKGAVELLSGIYQRKQNQD